MSGAPPRRIPLDTLRHRQQRRGRGREREQHEHKHKHKLKRKLKQEPGNSSNGPVANIRLSDTHAAADVGPCFFSLEGLVNYSQACKRARLEAEPEPEAKAETEAETKS